MRSSARRPRPRMHAAGYWLQALGAALPACSTYFLNYILLSVSAS